MSERTPGLALLLWSARPETPELLATPFMHAAAAAAMEWPVEVFFSAASVRLLAPGTADSLRPGAPGDPTLAHFMREARNHGARFYACSASLAAAGLSPADVGAWVDGFAGASTVVARLAEPAWRVMVF